MRWVGTDQLHDTPTLSKKIRNMCVNSFFSKKVIDMWNKLREVVNAKNTKKLERAYDRNEDPRAQGYFPVCTHR